MQFQWLKLSHDKQLKTSSCTGKCQAPLTLGKATSSADNSDCKSISRTELSICVGGQACVCEGNTHAAPMPKEAKGPNGTFNYDDFTCTQPRHQFKAGGNKQLSYDVPCFALGWSRRSAAVRPDSVME